MSKGQSINIIHVNNNYSFKTSKNLAFCQLLDKRSLLLFMNLVKHVLDYLIVVKMLKILKLRQQIRIKWLK